MYLNHGTADPKIGTTLGGSDELTISCCVSGLSCLALVIGSHQFDIGTCCP